MLPVTERWCSWLRHCATNRKVAVSIPDDVIGILHWHNSSGRTMALDLTQPLPEMSTRNISWGLRRPVGTADKLTTFMCGLSWNLGASTSWNSRGLSRSVMGLLWLYLLNSNWQHSAEWQDDEIPRFSKGKKVVVVLSMVYMNMQGLNKTTYNVRITHELG